MYLGILSDTHEHMKNIEKAIKIFREREVIYAVHLGDYCAGPSVRAMEGMKVVGILGNNDGDIMRLRRNFEHIDGNLHEEEFRIFEEDELSIACYHGTIPQITEALIACRKYDVVLYGHTHEVDYRTVGNTLVLNPGSAHGFEKQGTIALLDTQTKKAEILTL